MKFKRLLSLAAGACIGVLIVTLCVGANNWYDPYMQKWVAIFRGASAGAAGSPGYVPQPAAGEESLFLRGDGTWSSVSGSIIFNLLGESPLSFEGKTTDTITNTFCFDEPTTARWTRFQDASGYVVVHSAAVTDIAGSRLTITGTTLNVDDDFLLNTGDTGTGDYDFTGAILLGETPLVFEGLTDNAFQTRLVATDPTAARRIVLQDADGTVVTDATPCTDIEGTGLTITAGVLNVDDAYLLNTGDTITGLLQCESPLAASLGKDETAGTPNTAGKARFWSAGDNAYYADLVANTMTASATFTLPAAVAAAESFLKMGTDGQIDYDTSTYLTAEAQDLAAVTAIGATTATATAFTGGLDLGVAATTAGDLDLHDAGTVKWYDDGNNTSVTFGPVGDGTTTLGITGSIDCSGDVSGATIGGITEANLLDLSANETVTGTWAWGRYTTYTFGNDTANVAPYLNFRRARDGTPTTEVANGDWLGDIRFSGWADDGSAYQMGAYIAAVVDGTPSESAADMPTSLIFQTAPDGTCTPVTRFRVRADGSAEFTETVTIGAAGGSTGDIVLTGTTSGAVTLKVADAAGTWTFTLPTTDGDSGQFLQTNGSGTASWGAVQSATDSVAGIVELAIASEVTTGTATDRAVTPDALAGSDFGKRTFVFALAGSGTALAVADGTLGLVVPAIYAGYNLVDVEVACHTKGVTGTSDIQLRRRRAGADVDMLTTKLTLGDEYYVSDETIDTDNDDLAAGDLIYIDVDAVHTTPPQGVTVIFTVQLP